ncbi:probable thionin-2.4 isoform X2 [Brassica napus]|uniref:probable thionin-2.4 isoform X2 n=1 Tax=Brassica oleracea var. oleracea TaxID=109376 RepID=UPI0006A732E5|nr:PREDICTED: probable thionin-2.4 isoform X2 [Brassica oleracea var. oleracea]XP_013736133.1 probable thionin-2.4 isoform X2 [Brassica napus]
MYCKKMEGKSVILSLLIMSLVVMVQIKVEARVCCPSQQSRNAYTACLIVFSRSSCLRASGCLEISGNVCPSGYPNDILENSGDHANEYCKLGCTSSVCGAMTSLHNSGEIVNEAFEQCANACATFCNKGSVKPAAETA